MLLHHSHDCSHLLDVAEEWPCRKPVIQVCKHVLANHVPSRGALHPGLNRPDMGARNAEQLLPESLQLLLVLLERWRGASLVVHLLQYSGVGCLWQLVGSLLLEHRLQYLMLAMRAAAV